MRDDDVVTVNVLVAFRDGGKDYHAADRVLTSQDQADEWAEKGLVTIPVHAVLEVQAASSTQTTNILSGDHDG